MLPSSVLLLHEVQEMVNPPGLPFCFLLGGVPTADLSRFLSVMVERMTKTTIQQVQSRLQSCLALTGTVLPSLMLDITVRGGAFMLQSDWALLRTIQLETIEFSCGLPYHPGSIGVIQIDVVEQLRTTVETGRNPRQENHHSRSRDFYHYILESSKVDPSTYSKYTSLH